MDAAEGITVLACPKLLDTLNVVLASQSPRRLEILQNRMRFKHVVSIPSTFPENLNKQDFKNPCDYAKETAKRKGQEVAQRIWKNGSSTIKADLIISADTVVVLGDRVLEKPVDCSDAKQMLFDLATSNEKHHVVTGVAIYSESLGTQTTAALFSTSSEVQFGAVTLKDIENYVAAGESLDKSGSYGIEGLGAMLIKSIKGCFYNIQGLPLYDVSVSIAKLYNEGLLKAKRDS